MTTHFILRWIFSTFVALWLVLIVWPSISPGTRSILLGVHCFFIHPWFVALGWWKLYGFPWDPRLWVAFFVHDLGYWGKPNMDGPEGETHPVLGASIMHWLFDHPVHGGQWYRFTLYHSRFYAKAAGANYSRLCVADKFAFVLTPSWLYWIQSNLSGEINEYMFSAQARSPLGNRSGSSWTQQWRWIRALKAYITAWVHEHKDLKEDKWTNREPVDIEDHKFGVRP